MKSRPLAGASRNRVSAAAAAFIFAFPASSPAQAPGPDVGRAGVRHFVVDTVDNVARYRVREQLAGFDLPNDAVGVTRSVSGTLRLDENGRLIANGSRFVVDLRQLASDRERRDRYLQRRTLRTDTFPTATLVPTAVHGLTSLPGTGSASFEVVGDLTIRGVTRPTTWKVTASFDGEVIAGTAATAFNFNAFSLDVPRVRSVLSIEDNIRLEYDFRLVPAVAESP